jgi:hypothetical protein
MEVPPCPREADEDETAMTVPRYASEVSEIVAVASSANEERAVETVFDRAALRYDIGVDAAPNADPHRVCFLGRSYAVDEDVATLARDLLRNAGLANLIVESDP